MVHFPIIALCGPYAAINYMLHIFELDVLGLVYKADPNDCQPIRTFLPRLRPYLVRVMLILVLRSARSCRPPVLNVEHIKHL